jgi:hypothetical protein
MEILYVGKKDTQDQGKIHIAVSSWYNVSYRDVDRYAWCNTDLSQYSSVGTWHLGSVDPASVGEYMAEVPAAWADLHTPGMYLSTGMDREGPTVPGPALHVYGAELHGNSPPNNDTLDVVTLLEYKINKTKLDSASDKDEWGGAAWLTSGNKSAVVFAGKKGFGKNYYGESNEGCGGKGYHVTGGFRPFMLFYDPADLAAVAAGTMDKGEPQPYATFDFADIAFVPWDQCGAGFKSAAYDRNNNLLYLTEYGDGERGIIHVFKVQPQGTAVLDKPVIGPKIDITVWPNPFNPTVTIIVGAPFNVNANVDGMRPLYHIAIYNTNGRLVTDISAQLNNNRVIWQANNHPAGTYIVKAIVDKKTIIKKLFLFR